MMKLLNKKVVHWILIHPSVVSSLFISIVSFSNFAWAETEFNPYAPENTSPSSVTMSLPCTPPGSRCNLEFLKCDTIVKQIETAVQKMIDDKMTYFYGKGLDVDLFASKGPNELAGTPLQLPICNLAEGEETEVNRSHETPKRSCGNLKHYVVGGIDTKTNSYGIRETAYLNGFYLQAWKCFKRQVFNELEANKSVKVNSLTAAATDLNEQRQKLMDSITLGSMNLVCNLPPSCQGQLDQCVNPDQDQQASACHRVGVCLLRSAELKLISAYEYIVFEEIESRARRSWLSHLKYIGDQVYSEVEQPCYRGLSCHMSGTLGYVSEDPRCVVRGMNSCYPTKYVPFMRTLIQRLYPDNGSCQ